MKSLLSICFATVYGLILRFFFAFFSDYMEVISLSLIVLSPLAIGFVTIALYGLEKVSDSTVAFFKPWRVTTILLVITIILQIEGFICWVIIYPFFSVAAGIGGTLAFYWLRWRKKQAEQTTNPDILDDFDKNQTLKLSPFLILPLLIGAIEDDCFLFPESYTVSREITISAPVERVWEALAAFDTISQTDQRGFLTKTLNLPKHLRTTLDTMAVGGKRTAWYERGLYFEETIVDYQPNQLFRVRIKSNPGSIPPNVLDEHVVVGGKYFKALEDTYRLTPLSNNSCLLQLSGRVEINTPFNWYAKIWACWLLSDTFDGLLQVINKRASQKTR